MAEQYDTVAFDRQVHQTFTELSMQRASIAGIVDAASHMLTAPVVLEDLAHQVLAVCNAGEDTATLLSDWERRSRRHTDTSTSPAPTSGGNGSPAAGSPEHWLSVSVGPRGEAWGRLIIPRSPDDPLRALTVLERAGVALVLHRMVERDRSGLHQRAQSGLLDDVLERRVSSQAEVAARAHALGLAKAREYVPLVIRLAQRDTNDDPVAIERRNAEYLETISHDVRAGGHTGLFTIRRDGDIDALVAIKPRRGQPADAGLNDAATRIAGAAARIDGVTDCVVAVGEPDPQIVTAVRNLDDAAHVAEVAAALEGARRPYYRAADVRLRGLIALLKDEPRVQAFAETELRALLLAAPEQLDLLRTYLQVNGNKAEAAARLHISRPVLYKRLRHIEEVTGTDLTDPESLLSLYVAVLVHDARGRAHRTEQR